MFSRKLPYDTINSVSEIEGARVKHHSGTLSSSAFDDSDCK